MSKTALIIVDLQNDYFLGGKMELVGIDQAAKNAASLLTDFRTRDLPIFHIQHFFHGPESPFFEKGTEGAEINDIVKPSGNEEVIQKDFPNSFQKTELHEKLKASGIENLVICGAMSHMCIDATTRAGADLGYKCKVIHDACATRDVEFEGTKVSADKVHAAYMSALAFAYAEVISVSDLK